MTHRSAELMPDAHGRHGSVAGDAFEADVRPRPRTWSQSVQFLSSSLLRLMVYVFLRWIPTSIVVKPIPAAYLLYLASHISNRSLTYDLVEDPTAPLNGASDAHATSPPSTPTKKKRNKNKKAHAPSSRPLVRRSRRTGVVDAVSALLFGSASSSPLLNKLSLLLNTLLFAFFLDAVLSPIAFPSHWEHHLHILRTGGLTPTSAKVHVRYPFPFGEAAYSLTDGRPQSLTDVDGLPVYTEVDPAIVSNPYPLRIIYREVLATASPGGKAGGSGSSGSAAPSQLRWERGPLLRLTPETDWSATARLDDLWPSTEYEWSVVFAHNHTRPFQEEERGAMRFVTFPDPTLPKARQPGAKTVVGPVFPRDDEDQNPFDDPHHFTFAASSCVKPDFPWRPPQFILWHWLFELFGHGRLSKRNHIEGFDLLAERAIDARRQLHPALRFFITMGDTIYADVPVWGGFSIGHYRNLYRNLFASSSFRRVFEKIPVIGIADDHEVKNNWSGGSAEETIQGAIAVGMQSWHEYIGAANPDNAIAPDEHWYTFRYGDTAFFVMDVRSHRAATEHEDDASKQVLGEQQKVALLQWLSAVNTSTTTFKFIVSSVPFNSLWGGKLDVDGQKDSWAAYLTERDELLDVMHYVPNVIVLSGDRHEFAAVSLARRKEEKEEQESGYAQWPVTEFSTSPMNMFYLPIRTLSQENGRGATDQEHLLKYLPDGNVKWTEFEVDTRDPSQPLVRATVIVDGADAWKVDLLGQPVSSAPRQAVGGIAKTLLEWLGFGSRSWF